MSGLATNYCPYCGREIPQFPIRQSKPGQYCFDDCPEGEGRRVSLLPPAQERPYKPGQSGLFDGPPGFDKNRNRKRR